MLAIFSVDGQTRRGWIRQVWPEGAVVEGDVRPSADTDMQLEVPMASDSGETLVVALQAVVVRTNKVTEHTFGIEVEWVSAESDESPAGIRAFFDQIGGAPQGFVKVHPPDAQSSVRRFVFSFPRHQSRPRLDAGHRVFAVGSQGAESTVEEWEDDTDPGITPSPVPPPAFATSPLAASFVQSVQQSVPPEPEPPPPDPAPPPPPRPAAPTSLPERARSPNEPPNRRRSARAMVYIEVAYAIKAQHFPGFITDVSRHGAFVQTRQKMPERGLTVTIAFPRSIASGVRRVRGQVVRTTESADYNERGFAIEFHSLGAGYLDDEFQRMLDQFIK
jgi:hypothetical protein